MYVQDMQQSQIVLTKVAHGSKMHLGSKKNQLHAQIQKWEQGVRTQPLENHKALEFLTNTGPDPLKIIKLPNRHLAIIGTTAKRHLNGVLLASR